MSVKRVAAVAMLAPAAAYGLLAATVVWFEYVRRCETVRVVSAADERESVTARALHRLVRLL